MYLVASNTRTNHLGSVACVCGNGWVPHKRRFLSPRRIQIRGQLKKPDTESTKKQNLQKYGSSSSTGINLRHAVPALLGGAALAAPCIFPAPVFAAVEQQLTTVAAATPQFQHNYHMVDDQTMCMSCMALGATFSILTLAMTGRFILSL